MLSISIRVSGGSKGLFACLFFIILASVLLTGCHTAAQRKAAWLRAEGQAFKNRDKLCNQNIQNNPAYQSVFSHMPYNPKEVHITQLADTAMPTAEQINIVIAIHNDKAQCRAQAIEDLTIITPSMIPIYVQGCHASDLITADLIERKITWGEANKRRVVLDDELKQKFLEETSRLNQELKMSHEAELSGRRAVGLAVSNALSEWGKQQQDLANQLQNQQLINRPLMTNCQIIGNSVNCTTY